MRNTKAIEKDYTVIKKSKGELKYVSMAAREAVSLTGSLDHATAFTFKDAAKAVGYLVGIARTHKAYEHETTYVIKKLSEKQKRTMEFY